MMTQENIPYTVEEIKSMVKTIESLRKTQKKYKQALERARKELQEYTHKDCDNMTRRTATTTIYNLFPELAESEDERIRKEIIDFLELPHPQFVGKRDHEKWIAWIEKQGNKIVDCPQNHQDVKYPNGGIVMEDFNGGEGFYKLHLDYLSKKHVEEVEEMVRTWNKEPKTSNENIKNCVEMCLTDANEQRFEDFGTTLKDCLAWLEKQKPNNNKREIDDAYLQGICDAKHVIEKQGEQKIDNSNTMFNACINALRTVGHSHLANWLEKQGEQKTVVYVPKFRVGDKLVSTKNLRLTYEVLEVGHINERGNPEYKVEIFTDGKSENPHNIHYMECCKVDEWAKLIEPKKLDADKV